LDGRCGNGNDVSIGKPEHAPVRSGPDDDPGAPGPAQQQAGGPHRTVTTGEQTALTPVAAPPVASRAHAFADVSPYVRDQRVGNGEQRYAGPKRDRLFAEAGVG